MPPSPSLSARMARATYFIDTMMVMDQNTMEMTPKTSPRVASTRLWSMLKTVCIAYSGLVPMSPKTTPRAANANADPLPAFACRRAPAGVCDRDGFGEADDRLTDYSSSPGQVARIRQRRDVSARLPDPSMPGRCAVPGLPALRRR